MNTFGSWSTETQQAFTLVKQELEKAQRNYEPMSSAHEGWAVILEEVDELWEEVKKKPSTRSFDRMEHEAIQVAAMAVRFLIDICGRATDPLSHEIVWPL